MIGWRIRNELSKVTIFSLQNVSPPWVFKIENTFKICIDQKNVQKTPRPVLSIKISSGARMCSKLLSGLILRVPGKIHYHSRKLKLVLMSHWKVAAERQGPLFQFVFLGSTKLVVRKQRFHISEISKFYQKR